MRVLLVAALALAACGTDRFVTRGAPSEPYDAVIVPGCPAEPDGTLSRCQMARAVWAARLWQLGWTKGFITSGSAVYTPYVEAEALAQALVALGVPADRIWLEPNALHTDENMVYSMQIARALGFHKLAVASNAAAWDCLMLLDWAQECHAYELDFSYVKQRHAELGHPLEQLRVRPAPTFVPLRERERELARRSGRHRPPSFALYLGFAFLRANGERWIPPGLPDRPPLVTWAQASSRSVSAR